MEPGTPVGDRIIFIDSSGVEVSDPKLLELGQELRKLTELFTQAATLASDRHGVKLKINVQFEGN